MVLENAGVVLGFSTSHAGPGLEGVRVVETVLLVSDRQVDLGTAVFVGKSLKGVSEFTGDSALKEKKVKIKKLMDNKIS